MTRMKIHKRDMPVFASLIISFSVLTVLYSLRESALREQALTWVLRISLGSIGVLAVIFVVCFLWGRRLPRMKNQAWISSIPHAIILYLGILVISLSYYKDLLLGMSWDPTMVGLGLAILAFGWVLFTQRRELQAKGASGELGEDVSAPSRKAEALNEKLSKLEKVIDTFLHETQKFAQRINRITKEDKNENNKT